MLSKAKSRRNQAVSCTSPSDWPPDRKEFSALDTLLRCPICYDFYNTAMIVPGCSHNFCSLCIRKYLLFKRQCPTCTTHVTDSMLKNNRVLDEIIDLFLVLRSLYIPMEAAKVKQTPVKIEKAGVSTPSISKKVEKNLSKRPRTLDHFYSPENAKKATKDDDRKNCPDDDDICIIESRDDKNPGQREAAEAAATKVDKTELDSTPLFTNITPLCHNKRELSPPVYVKTKNPNEESSCSKLPISNSQQLTGPNTSMSLKKTPLIGIVTPLESHDYQDFDFKSSTCPFRKSTPQKSVKGKSKNTQLPNTVSISSPDISPASSQGSELPDASQPLPELSLLSPENEPGSQQFTPDIDPLKVPCPACGTFVSSAQINSHLDICLTSGEKRSSLRKKRSRKLSLPETPVKRRPMPKLVYSLLSKKELKKKLEEVGLSTKGEYHVLVKRHQEFSLAYNAQCDSLNPKSAQELAKEFERLECLKCDLATSTNETQRYQIDKGSTPEDIETARKTYLQQHKDHFKKLVKLAKKNRKSNGAKEKSESVNPDKGQSMEESVTNSSSLCIESDQYSSNDLSNTVTPTATKTAHSIDEGPNDKEETVSIKTSSESDEIKHEEEKCFVDDTASNLKSNKADRGFEVNVDCQDAHANADGSSSMATSSSELEESGCKRKIRTDRSENPLLACEGEVTGDSWPPLSQKTRSGSVVDDAASDTSSPLLCFLDLSQPDNLQNRSVEGTFSATSTVMSDMRVKTEVMTNKNPEESE